MKSKLIAIALVGIATSMVASAVSVTVTTLANASVGFVTTPGASAALVTGSYYIYSSTNNLSALDVASVTSRTQFEALLTAPTVVRNNIAFTAGAFNLSNGVEAGAVGNSTYLFIQSSDANFIGIFQANNVPSVGAVTFTPAAITEDLKGTSTTQTLNSINSGWQLVAIPEPSAALLGMLGALGLLRRRR